MTYITWKDSDTSKNVVYAFNDKEEKLGSLRFEGVGRHHHWCWYQNNMIRMSPSCLEEVRLKQKELFHKRRTKND